MTSLPPIPASAQTYIDEAAKGTGLPVAVVAAQNYTESDYGENQGPSSAGAEGPWQFEPSTFDAYGSGSITSWPDSTAAYIKLMNTLLSQYNGNVSDALAAYNAGPGNLAAGAGYASTILSLAGSPQSLKDGSPGSTTPTTTTPTTTATDASFNWTEGTPFEGITWFGKLITGASGPFSTIGDVAKAIAGLTTQAGKLLELFAMLFRPEFWLRVGAFLVGAVTLAAGLYFLKGSIAS